MNYSCHNLCNAHIGFLQALIENPMLPFPCCPWEETLLQTLISSSHKILQPHSQEWMMILIRKSGSNQRLFLKVEKAQRCGTCFEEYMSCFVFLFTMTSSLGAAVRPIIKNVLVTKVYARAHKIISLITVSC